VNPRTKRGEFRYIEEVDRSDSATKHVTEQRESGGDTAIISQQQSSMIDTPTAKNTQPADATPPKEPEPT
jgi:hypothetical protein